MRPPHAGHNLKLPAVDSDDSRSYSDNLYLWQLAGASPTPEVSPQRLGFTYRAFDSPAELHRALKRNSESVVLVRFPESLEVGPLTQLERLISEHPVCAWIALLDAQAADERLAGLISRAFFDYHHLPIEYPRLRLTVGHAFGMLALQRRVKALASSGDDPVSLLGHSEAIERTRQHINKIADTSSTVLIYGESGTGKELVAQSLHRLSSRRTAPFEALNCAALPPSLIQAELFGHERGAYTDAHQRKPGRFESCSGGTLFLDEIGDMPLEQQVNLLRVLEQGRLRRIGGTRDIPIDVRIIAATNNHLETAVAEGRFREDLYYRLNVLRIDIPPLRDRDGDIEMLARYFLHHYRESARSGPKAFSQEALTAMYNHSWPGNVRELLNRVQHALMLADGALITPSDLGIERRESHRLQTTLEDARNDAEVKAINNALHQHRHNVSKAARQLGISRITLYRLMNKHDIPPR